MPGRRLRTSDSGFWEQQRAAGKIRVVVPTIDSARHIDIVLTYYRSIGVPVTVFVDRKTRDDTAAIARRHADDVVLFDNPSQRVGAMLEGMSRHFGTEWVLRIDDDELPSVAMMEFVASVLSARRCDVVGFGRYQCLFDHDGGIHHDATHGFEAHRQWRLYRPARVRFHGRGHTAGFDFKAHRGLAAPPPAFMIHLDWIVHSPAERLQKLRRYDADTPGHGMAHKAYYLGDAAPDLRERLKPLPGNDFVRTAASLNARFPETVVGPP